jgi:hypothetical protein
VSPCHILLLIVQKLMGLGNRECADIEADVKQAAYK